MPLYFSPKSIWIFNVYPSRSLFYADAKSKNRLTEPDCDCSSPLARPAGGVGVQVGTVGSVSPLG